MKKKQNYDKLFTTSAKSKFRPKSKVWNYLCERHETINTVDTSKFDCNTTQNEYTVATSQNKNKSTLDLQASLISSFLAQRSSGLVDYRAYGSVRFPAIKKIVEKLTFLTEISFFAFNKSQTHTHIHRSVPC